MSYDFVIQAAALPSGSSFPLSIDDLIDVSPEAISATISNAEDFWKLLASYPGMSREAGIHGEDSFIYSGRKIPGSGFRVYAVRKIPFSRLKNSFSPEIMVNADTQCEARRGQQYAGEASKEYPLQGIQLDMSGSAYDVLELYVHLKRKFQNLVVLDKQTGLIHDEHSLSKILDALGS